MSKIMFFICVGVFIVIIFSGFGLAYYLQSNRINSEPTTTTTVTPSSSASTSPTTTSPSVSTSPSTSASTTTTSPSVSPTMTAGGFALDDTQGIYTVHKENDSWLLYYQKSNNNPEAVLIENATSFNLTNYLNKSVIVTGEFVTRAEDVECNQEVCSQVYNTVLRLSTIKEK